MKSLSPHLIKLSLACLLVAATWSAWAILSPYAQETAAAGTTNDTLTVEIFGQDQWRLVDNAADGSDATRFRVEQAIPAPRSLALTTASDLITDGGLYTVTYNSTYQDYTIPEVNPPDTITLLVKGGDGGDAYISYGWACGVSSCSGDGGKGAELGATFEIGAGAGQLQPGGTLRFVVGEAGASKSLDAWACGGNRDGGGGGGSAVLYKAPGVSWSLDNAVMLVVAGAGGGGSAGSVWAGSCTQDTDGSDGLPNSTSGGDSSEHHGGDNGCGGGRTRSSDDTTTSCSDVDDTSLYVVDAGGWYGEGMSGGTFCGAEPGQSGSWGSGCGITLYGTFEGGDGASGDTNAGDGGYGFGGGGAGISEWPVAGGGGGYSGGGGGQPSGGGGSYINSAYAIAGTETRQVSSSDYDGGNGFATYQVSYLMTVSGNGTAIENGDTTPSVGDDTDFGVIAEGGSTNHTFTIRNTSLDAGDTLNLSGSPAVSLVDGAHFSLVQPAATSLANGASTTFQVVFNPQSAGSFTDTVSIPSNAGTSPYTFVVAGSGGFRVESVEPAQNSLNVSAAGAITLTYAANVDSGSVSVASLTVRGEQTGDYAGTYNFPAADTVVFDPTATLKAGEVLRVTASSQVLSTGGLQSAPYQWQFTVANQDAASGDGAGMGDMWYEQTVVGSFGGAEWVTAADIDSDGDLDLLGAARLDNIIAWWENDGAQGFTRHNISGFSGASAAITADVDGDGDLDVLGAAINADTIAWWENDGSENFTQHVISNTFDGAIAVAAADVDGDSDLDVLGAAETANTIAWWENDGSESFTLHTISSAFTGAQAVTTADLDGDGDLDVLGTASSANDIVWWENDGGQSFTEHAIAIAFSGAIMVSVADIDKDGDLDVLGAASGAGDIAWWENDGGQNFSKYTIDSNFAGADAVTAADVDGDGDMDVLGAAGTADDIVWWENNGSQNFTQRTIDPSFAGATAVTTADMDGDGDLDVLGAAYTADDLTIWYNQADPDIAVEGNGVEISAGDITPATGDDTDFGILTVGESVAHTFTIHHRGGYGDNDLTLSGSPAITLSDNTHFSVVQPGATTLSPGESATFQVTFAPQSGGDLTATIIIPSNDPDESPFTFVVGGAGRPQMQTVSPAQNSLNVDASSSVSATYDGAMDSSSVSAQSFTIRGEQTGIYQGTYRFPADETLQFEADDAFQAGEVVRVTASSQLLSSGGTAAIPYQWQFTAAAQDGSGTGDTWQEQIIVGDFDGATSVYAADLDSDGDIDVLGAASTDGDIAWWENDGGQGFTKHTLLASFRGAWSAYATDIDSDGDMDVLGAANTDDDIAWWENDGGQGFNRHILNGSFDGARSVYAADLDGDGDMDILGAADTADDITWWENDGSESFTEHAIDSEFNGAWSVYAADLDGDGDMDVLGAAETANEISWWENDGSENFTKNSIDPAFSGARSVYAVDIDRDGDMDVIGAGYDAREVAWWENDGNQNFSKQLVTDDSGGTYTVYAADVDGDSDVDILAAAEIASDLIWWENDGSQNFVSQSIHSNFNNARSVYAADMDGDGDLDVLGAASLAQDIKIWYNLGTTEIAVWGNADGNPVEISSGDTTPDTGDSTDFGTLNAGESLTYTFIIQNAAGYGDNDLTLNGSPAVTLTSGTYFTVTQPASTTLGYGEFTTFELTFTPHSGGTFTDTVTILNSDPDESPYTFVVGGVARVEVQAVSPAENSLNVAATSVVSLTYNAGMDSGTVSTATLMVRGEQTGIYEGTYTFPAAETLAIDPANSFKAGEVVRVTASSQILSTDGTAVTPYQWQFTAASGEGNGTGDLWQAQVLTDTFAAARSVTAADVDGDGDLDVLGSAYGSDTLTWWENDGTQNFAAHIITDTFDGATAIAAADVDGDGDLDFLGAANNADTLAWWENDGAQTVTAHIVDDNFRGVVSVSTADLDGDGDLDLLGASSYSDAIAWWENDGSQNFSKHTIDGNFDAAYAVRAADVDGDGDVDVLGAAANGNTLAWWENADQDDSTWSRHIIDSSFAGARSIAAADVDGDGDLDILGAAINDDAIAWWENDGSANFTRHTLTSAFSAATHVHAADVDGDGNTDILGAAFGADTIAWWENDGSETFTAQTITATFAGARWVTTADMDGDGDLDVLGSAYNADTVAIWYNLGEPKITVLGSGVEISNSDTTPGPDDATDFGQVIVGNSITHTFVISNAGGYGDDDLTLSGAPAVTLADGSQFTVIQPAVTSLGFGESTIFTVTFAPQSRGRFTDTVTIANNDPDESPYSFVVGGTGVAADVSLVKSVTPTSAEPGQTITYTLTFANVGDGTASGVVITDFAPFSVIVQRVISSGDVGITETQTGAVFETAPVSPGQGGVITLTAVVTQPLAAGVFTNTAAITTAATDSDTGNNDAAAGLRVSNVAPVLDPIDNQTITETETLTFTASASDANGDELTYGLFSGPDGTSINSSNVVSWTPTETDALGAITLVVTDSSGLTDTTTVLVTVIEVNSAPILDPIDDQTVDEGATLSFTATATDSDWPANTLTYSLNGEPDGAAISSSGVFSWTTMESDGPGLYPLTVIVSDGLLTDSEVMTITVNEVNTAPVADAGNDQTVYTNASVTLDGSASSDADGDSLTYGWTQTDGAAVSFTPNLSVTIFTAPPTAEVLTFGLTVTDTTGLTATASLVITVTEPNIAPVLAPISNQTITETETLTFTVNASDANGDDLTFGLDNPAAGMSLDQSGLFAWTPTEAQGAGAAYFVTVLVTDTTGLTDSTTAMITVYERNSAPLLAAIPPQTVAVTKQLTFTTVATDTDLPAQTLTYSLAAGAPTGATIEPFSGLFAWTPTSAGLYTVTVMVADDGTPVLTNSVEVGLSVTEPVLTLAKTVTPALAQPGDPITYTLAITNSGHETAMGVSVVDTLPAGVAGQDLNWTGTVTAGEAVTFTLVATVRDEAGYGVTILNTATYSHASSTGSDSAAFSTIADTTPPTFTVGALITPTGGVSLTGLRPTFEWEPASDSQSEVVSYTLRLSGTNGVQDIATTASSYTSLADLALGVYTWTVCAHDGAGNASKYISPAETFEIVESNVSTSVYLPLVRRN